jgi:hypothetical protein
MSAGTLATFISNRAGSGRMKSALVLAAAANALVAPSAPAASTVVRQGVIQTPPILTREDGLETRPMAADMPGIGQCINQVVATLLWKDLVKNHRCTRLTG